jgi:diguanylate cyclase (GGDEF)-like protein
MAGRIPRKLAFMLVGFTLSLACPIGWWVMRSYFGPQITDLHMYVYLIVGGGSAFAMFGYTVGLLYDRLQEMIDQDALTGMLNEPGFHKACRSVFNLACRFREPVTLLRMDIDQFKVVNDRYGHAAGEVVLLEISNILKSVLRKSDVAARVSGDEFLVFLPRVEPENGKIVADRLRERIGKHRFDFERQHIHIQVSIGLHGTVCDSHTAWDEIIKKSRATLQAAKASGPSAVMVG